MPLTTLPVRLLLWVVGLLAAAALLVFWRSHQPDAPLHDDGPARTAVSSTPAPFSPVAAAPSAAGHPALPPPQPPAVTVAAAEPADASAASAPEADVEQRQDAKIARGLINGDSGGVLVVATPQGSVAGALHLQPGDLITAVDGQPADIDRAIRTPVPHRGIAVGTDRAARWPRSPRTLTVATLLASIRAAEALRDVRNVTVGTIYRKWADSLQLGTERTDSGGAFGGGMDVAVRY